MFIKIHAMEPTKKHVCVIGAGVAGLCTARHLLEQPYIMFDVFEQTGRVGGTWVFTEETDTDEFDLSIHSSMYRNLRTSLPKECMKFPDFPFKDLSDSFIHHSEVLNYLEDYAYHFNIYKNIQFYTSVKNVKPQKSNNDSCVWLVITEDLRTRECKTTEYDAVFICNGHYSVPYIPEIPGIENFKGITMHSHSYREPQGFENKTIVILGAADSGKDITLELCPYSKQIYISHRLQSNIRGFPENITQVPEIVSASNNGFKFSNGTEVTADVLIYCTGYEYSFPFLSEECKVKVNDKRITPLYKHMIHTDFPTLYFIGIPSKFVGFALFDLQVIFCIKCLNGSIVLSNKEDMDGDIEKDYKHKLSLNMPHRYAHVLADMQWKYYEELAHESNTELLSPVYKKILDDVLKRREESVLNCKNYHYKVINEDSFTVNHY